MGNSFKALGCLGYFIFYLEITRVMHKVTGKFAARPTSGERGGSTCSSVSEVSCTKEGWGGRRKKKEGREREKGWEEVLELVKQWNSLRARGIAKRSGICYCHN